MLQGFEYLKNWFVDVFDNFGNFFNVVPSDFVVPVAVVIVAGIIYLVVGRS